MSKPIARSCRGDPRVVARSCGDGPSSSSHGSARLRDRHGAAVRGTDAIWPANAGLLREAFEASEIGLDARPENRV